MIAFSDVMFQLLIFFMLSANMNTYSLLPIRNGALASPGGGAAAADPAGVGPEVSDPLATAVWSIGTDSIVANGQRFALERVPDLAAALKAQSTDEVLLIAQRGSSVQMLVSILEILSSQGITSVRVADGAPT